jgi:hypothetical protein
MRWLPWFACVLAASCFVDRPVSKLVKAGVELRKVTSYEAPHEHAQEALVAMPGDFVLTGGGLRVVLGGMRRDLDLRGAVLEATWRDMSVVDSMVVLAPRVYVDGISRPIRIDRMFMVERANAPALRVEGAVKMRDRVVQLARELSLGRAPGTISISTRLITYEPEGEADVRLGARIAWGGPRPFVPGVGDLSDEDWHHAPWVGSEGATGSAFFGYEEGPLAVRAAFEHLGNNALLLHTEIAQGHGIQLAVGKPHYDKSMLALTTEGVAQAARTFGFWRGAPYKEAWVYLPYRPAGAQVELRDGAGALLLRGRPDAAGRVVLPLEKQEGPTPSSFEAVATAYGHAPSDARPVGAGEQRPVELVIPRGGRVRLRVRDADGETPLSARVRLVPLEQTPKLSLGPDYRGSGAGDTVIALAGDLSIDVPPGRYHVIVTHGPEWSLHEQDVEVSETYSPRVEAALEHQVDPSSWVACDLHVHAAPSPDSEVTLEDRLASLAAEGVNFAVATDHNHVTDYAPIAQLMSLDDMRTMTGVEVTTWEPQLGHFNAYPYPLDPKRPDNGAPDRMQTDPRVLFRLLHAVDPEIVVQVNHPRSEGGIGYFETMHYDPVTGAADATFSSEYDALEVYNGFDLAVPEHMEQVFNDFLNILERGQRVAATGSSDSHQVRYQLAGYPRTYAFVPPELGSDPRAVVRAIKAGASFVTTGPFLEVSIAGGGPGTTVQAQDKRVTLSVRVQAPAWMDVSRLEVFVGKERVLERAIPKPAPRKRRRPFASLRLDVADITLPVASDTFVIVRVQGDVPNDAFFGRFGITPRAFSNPIFIDVDGDGETPWPPPGSAPKPSAPSAARTVDAGVRQPAPLPRPPAPAGENGGAPLRAVDAGPSAG